MGYFYVSMTIFFTVYGQLVLKWQVNEAGQLPVDLGGKIFFLFKLLLNPWIISGFVSAFVAALSWMAAMTKFELSYAYPFVSITFVLVVLSGAIFFNEPLSWPKIAGMVLIVGGILVGSQG
jgi:multidrug transporter EmrE-like cation transporter